MFVCLVKIESIFISGRIVSVTESKGPYPRIPTSSPEIPCCTLSRPSTNADSIFSSSSSVNGDASRSSFGSNSKNGTSCIGELLCWQDIEPSS